MGPYSKKYFGITHIPEIERGLSFDLSLFPMAPGTQGKIPSVLDAAGTVHVHVELISIEELAMRIRKTVWQAAGASLLAVCGWAGVQSQRTAPVPKPWMAFAGRL